MISKANVKFNAISCHWRQWALMMGLSCCAHRSKTLGGQSSQVSLTLSARHSRWQNNELVRPEQRYMSSLAHLLAGLKKLKRGGHCQATCFGELVCIVELWLESETLKHISDQMKVLLGLLLATQNKVNPKHQIFICIASETCIDRGSATKLDALFMRE